MGRIGASLSGIERALLNQLAASQDAVEIGGFRLATGKSINAAADNPSRFVALSNFETQLVGVNAALSNVTVASSVGSQTQLTVDQIRTELNTIRTKALADVDQALTSEERTANQAAIDAAITAINELTRTEVSGRRYLDGSADFQYADVVNSEVSDVQAFTLGGASSLSVSGTVSVAAEQATLTHTEGTGLITNDATITITGSRGSASVSVTTGESLATVATRVNQEAYLTGVTATVDGNDLDFTTIDYGSNASLSITTSDTFNGAGSATGVDAQATINSQSLTGDGNRFTLADSGANVAVEFAAGHSGAFTTFTISGTPPLFALTTDLSRTTEFAVRGAQAARLGGLSGTLDQLATGGTAAGLDTNSSLAVRIVDEALDDLDLIEGQVDAFADIAVASAGALLDAMQDSLEDTIDEVGGIDETAESVLLARNQALADNAIAALAILDQQRSSIVGLIQQIAGLAH
ncbi:MAG: hypothetical protein DWQ31_12200 [Planctomycetota bacterium]|nr:MAG: hypothetical protein DWQ31_12200 [Planctomycetota bacterium]